MKSEPVVLLAREFSFHSVQDLLANIGYGKISAIQVMGRLKPKLGIEENKHAGIVSKMVSRIKRKKTTRGIRVKGVDNMMVRFANCCNPLPGERVIGFITRGRGVTIHKNNCRHLKNADAERLVEVSWETSKEDIYTAKLRITSMGGKGVLAEISAAMAQKDANIIQADIKTTVDKKGISSFTVEVSDYQQLQDIIGAIKRVKNVLLVERL